jgi:hypothetical protein
MIKGRRRITRAAGCWCLASLSKRGAFCVRCRARTPRRARRAGVTKRSIDRTATRVSAGRAGRIRPSRYRAGQVAWVAAVPRDRRSPRQWPLTGNIHGDTDRRLLADCRPCRPVHWTWTCKRSCDQRERAGYADASSEAASRRIAFLDSAVCWYSLSATAP